jgi:chromosome segregation ATPase
MEFHELQQIVESNSRAIQALADRISELTHVQEEAAEERAELRQATIGIANLISSLDSDRPTILRKLSTIENKVDRLLSQSNGDQPQP